MKRILLFLLAICASIASYGQTARTTTIKGIVVDAANNSPMAGAVVLVDSTKHALTDAKGTYIITGVPIKDVNVEIMFMGYKTVKQSVKTSAAVVNLGIIKMVADSKIIEQVVVEGEVVVAIQKGDTTQYNATAFKVNPDAYAGDLLAKMPGMDVSETGVTAQGESVSRVYVDGKLMFGDDPMAAINNLPADQVESIQMFDELSDEAKFSGYDDGRLKRSINIITKYKIKTAATGRIEGGYGKELDKNIDNKFQDRYTVNGQANIFSAKRTVMIGATINNTNSSTGRGGYGRGGGTGGLNTIGSFNVSYNQEIVNKLKFNLNYIFNGTSSESNRRTLQNYFPTNQFTSRIYADTSKNNSKSYRHNVGMRVEYTLNRNNRFFFTPRLSFGNGNSFSTKKTSTSTELTNLSSLNDRINSSNRSKSSNYNTGGALVWSRNLGKAGRNLSLRGNIGLSENDGNNLQLDTLPESTRQLNLTTLTSGWSRSYSGRITYSEPLSVSSRISANYELRYENSKSDKLVYDNNNMGDLDPVLSNIYSRNYTTNNAGVSYSFSKGDFRISAGLDYESSKLNKDQKLPLLSTPLRSYVFGNYLPQFNFRYNISKTKNIKLAYNADASLPSIEQLQNVISNSNPLLLTAGNPSLKESYSHNVNFSYNTSNLAKSTTFNLSLRASATNNSSSTKTVFFEQDVILHDYNDYPAKAGTQLRTPVNINGKFNLFANGTYGIRIKPIKSRINFDLNYAFQRTPSYNNQFLNFSNANNSGFRISLESNISTNVDFTLSSRTGYNFATNTTKANTNYFTQSTTGRVNLIFLKGFVFSSDATYNYNKSSSSTGYTTTYTVWNAGLGHKFFNKRQGEIKVMMYDILKQNKSINHTINDNYIADTWTNTIGRYIMATFSYRFNSLNSVQTKNSTANRPQWQSGGGYDRGGYEGGVNSDRRTNSDGGGRHDNH